MTLHKQYTSVLTLSLLTSTLLSACGGGGSSSTNSEQPAKPLVSSFGSSLTLQDEGQPVQVVSSRYTSDDKDSTLAYSVSSILSNNRSTFNGTTRVSFPGLYQKFSFQLGASQVAPILDIIYNPLRQQPVSVTLTRDKDSAAPDILNCLVNNRNQPESSCQGFTLNYGQASGKVDITFNNTILRKTVNPTSHVHTITLNGQLTGELSIAPQGLQDIPQNSSGKITLNNKVLKILAASSSSND